ncbi:MAG: class I SAM-dependent methyltransferase [Acetobacteraceae bacterium]
MAVDEVFADDFFASLYDFFNPWTPSDEFYLGLARERGGRVLDLGCGTGMLACRIAADGCSVTGLDPAPGMLKVARAREGADAVTWIEADGRVFRSAARFDLIIMTGHAFQALLTDEDALALLRTAAHHLAEGGRFAFETRNPAHEAWRGWTRANGRVVTTEQYGRVEESYDTEADATTGIVRLTHWYRFLDEGTQATGHSRLRFIGRAHLERLLAAAGLVPAAWYGDWDRAPLTPDSREMIVVAHGDTQ